MKRYFLLFISLMCITCNVNAISLSNEDMIRVINNIFQNKISDSYSIEYSNDVDINEINKYFKTNYMLSSSNTNVYTYEDFIIFDKIRNYPVVQDNKYNFSVKFNLVSKSEYDDVIKFGKELNNKYNNLSEDEKVYLVINYIKNNITKSGFTSLYEAIYNYNSNDTYLLVQFMLSNLNVESYITERLNTGKKYNLVKLHDKWYILDIDNDYILVGYNTADFKPDTYSNNVLVSKYNYSLETYNIDYNEIKYLIDGYPSKDNKNENEQNDSNNKSNSKIAINVIEWIVLLCSLCVIILLVRHYTR